jgi:hypothetical protein
VISECRKADDFVSGGKSARISVAILERSMKFLRRFRVTLAALLLAFALIAAGRMLHLNVINLESLQRIDRHSVDDVIVGLVLIILGVSIDSALARQRLAHEQEKLLVLKATMRTVQDIMNNFLASVQIYAAESEDYVTLETRKMLEERIRDAATKLQTLGNLASTPMREVAAGPVIDYESARKERFSAAA